VTALRRAVQLGICLIALTFAAPAHAAFPGAPGKIAFASDRSGHRQIYTINPDGTGLTNISRSAGAEWDPAWSADGNFITYLSADHFDGGGNLYFMKGDGARKTHVLSASETVVEPSWAPDSTKIAFDRYGFVETIRPDSTDWDVVAQSKPPFGVQPAWSPDGTTIAFGGAGGIHLVNPDGTGDHLIYPEGAWPNWSPDGARIVVDVSSDQLSVDGLYVMDADGTDAVHIPNTYLDGHPAWSPDGSKLVVQTYVPPAATEKWLIQIVDPTTGVHTALTDPSSSYSDTDPDWQPAPTSAPMYARPKGATPILAPLVIAYEPCGAPTSQHGAPLAHPSCSPPVQASQFLTVGTPDSNGEPAKFVGSVTVKAIVGSSSTPENEADVRLGGRLTDVRCRVTSQICPDGPLTDYTGRLFATASLTLTDQNNGPTGYEQGTLADYSVVRFGIPCTATADTTVGSTCAISTSANAVVPGMVKESYRTIWQLGPFQVMDGGSDGNQNQDDQTLFASQGLLVP
jgi:hypothetical protein